MTYKDVIDDLLDIFKRHKMIQTWGYGNLSDLVSPFKKSDSASTTAEVAHDVYNVDYPYAFLQPLAHSLQKGKSTFNFNLIMMEQCEDEHMDVIQAQSNCYQYIQDVLAEIYYNYDQKFDFTLNSTVNPFREKYNDTVSGMTANISLEIPMILDDCIAPFRPKPEPPESGLVVDVESAQDQYFRPDVSQSPLQLPVTNLDTYSGMRPPPTANFYRIEATGNWRFVVEGVVRRTTDDGDQFPDSLEIVYRTKSGNNTYVTGVGNWPTDPPVGLDTPFRLEYPAVFLDPDTGDNDTSIDYVAWVPQNDPEIEDEFDMKAGTIMKGYFEA